jgi:hypothetical protein
MRQDRAVHYGQGLVYLPEGCEDQPEKTGQQSFLHGYGDGG